MVLVTETSDRIGVVPVRALAKEQICFFDKNI